MIVPIVNGIAPDGRPFEAGAPLESRYETDFAAWVKELVDTGGATDNTPPPPAPVTTGNPRRRRRVDAAATLTRDQEVTG